MIINIRGTHGSGKSTLVRTVMGKYERKMPIYTEGRKRPFLYRLGSEGKENLAVLGSYENVTGGCDTIPKVEEVFDCIKNNNVVSNILFEGILAQHSAPRLIEVAKMFPTKVIVLNTPLDQCIESVKTRRAERGEEKPFNPDNVIREHKSVESAYRRLKQENIDIVKMSRDEALAETLRLLGW